LYSAIVKEKDMKKLALSIVILVLFAAVASAIVPEAGKEAAAQETVAAAETKILLPAAEAEDPQPSKPVQEVFAKQKAIGAEPTQELTTTLSPELSTQQLAIAPQFIKSASPSEVKKSTAVEESAVERETEYKEAEENGISDPLEPWNRAMFTFNDKLYFWAAKPLARGYSAIVPEWGRVRVKNIFQNISMPVRFVNNLLQLKIRGAGTELLRFVFNTTAGVGGMFDVARNIDLKVSDEDLGQTLGVYGIGNGFYIVWPVLGPSSLRDTVGTVGDYFLDPVSYITPTESQIGVRTFDYTNETSLHIGDYEDMKESAIDPYISFRSAYIEYRKNKIKE
jgi:phospholipid-binding lipoprotein MlaA